MAFCHNCGAQLNESAKFCPSCGTPFQGTQSQTQETLKTAAIPPPHPASQSFQSAPANPVHQQNVVIMGKAKSVGVAFILAFFFGPLGLFYASIVGGVVMIFVQIVFAFVFFPALIVGQIICIIWACVAADQANKSMVNRGNAVINNQFQR